MGKGFSSALQKACPFSPILKQAAAGNARIAVCRRFTHFITVNKEELFMYNKAMFELGNQPSVIRELFAYGLQQAKIVGPENVFDYTLGNPSIPAPAKVNQSIKDILSDMDSIAVHGYSMAGGFDGAREAIAKNLNQRFGTDIKAANLFITCGAAPALISTIKALLADEKSEIMAVAPFFPEYRPFVEENGGNLVVVPADREHFQIDLTKNTAIRSTLSLTNRTANWYTATLKFRSSQRSTKIRSYATPGPRAFPSQANVSVTYAYRIPAKTQRKSTRA